MVASSPLPDLKVICLGHMRTGTLSLSHALESLGYGPCYHPLRTNPEKDDWLDWRLLYEDEPSPERIHKVLGGYRSVVDCPAAIIGNTLYALYPNAKYILTVREPTKWESSIQQTFFPSYNWGKLLEEKGELTPVIKSSLDWGKAVVEKYHGGRLFEHTQEEFILHNERIKRLIPEKQLLIYQVGEGWDRLAEFLDVPNPMETFPHLNEGAKMYNENLSRALDSQAQRLAMEEAQVNGTLE